MLRSEFLRKLLLFNSGKPMSREGNAVATFRSFVLFFTFLRVVCEQLHILPSSSSALQSGPPPKSLKFVFWGASFLPLKKKCPKVTPLSGDGNQRGAPLWSGCDCLLRTCLETGPSAMNTLSTPSSLHSGQWTQMTTQGSPTLNSLFGVTRDLIMQDARLFA